MINANLQIEVLTVGDGQNHTYVYNWPSNTNSAGPSSIIQSSAGNLTVTVPTNAAGVFIVAPTTAGTYKLKGVSGDVGVTISAGGFLGFRFSSVGAVGTFVLNSSNNAVTWTIYWL